MAISPGTLATIKWGAVSSTASTTAYLTDVSITSNSTTGSFGWVPQTSLTFKTVQPTYTMNDLVVACPAVIPASENEFTLPDGAKLLVDDKGNYRIEDKDAKVTYKANRMREFSPHLNASDMVAAFVKYVGGLGVRQDEVLQLPIELFINWLVIEAAERDQDRIPDGVQRLEQRDDVKLIVRPRCLKCKRFIPRLHARHKFPFCDPVHAGKFLAIAG